MPPKFWNEQECCKAEWFDRMLHWIDLIIVDSFDVFSFPVIVSSWLDSSPHGRWAASCSLLKMENSREAPTEICLSATCHIKWSDLLSFLAKNVHNHDDKCEPNAFYLIILLNLHLILEYANSSQSWNSTTSWVCSVVPGGKFSSRVPEEGTRVCLCFSALVIFCLAGERSERVVPSRTLCLYTARKRVNRLTSDLGHSSPEEGWQGQWSPLRVPPALTYTFYVSGPQCYLNNALLSRPPLSSLILVCSFFFYST